MKKRRIVSLVLCLAVVLGALVFPSVAADETPTIRDVEIVDIAVGYYHTLALDSDGHVWSWGTNTHGELGIGYASTERDRFVHQVPGLEGIVKISAGWANSFAITSDGELWAWGNNSNYQLGTGNTTDCYSPIKVPLISNVHSVANRTNHVIALTNDGLVYSWGLNTSRQTGQNPNSMAIRQPTKLDSLWDVVQIDVSQSASYAIIEDGTVWAWGDNSLAQIGDGTTITRSNPTLMHNLEGIVNISSGNRMLFAVKNDGTLWTTNGSTKVPGESSLYVNLVSVAAGTDGRGYVLTDEGIVKEWSTGETIISNVAKLYSQNRHSIVILDDGSIWGWGNNVNGQLRPHEVYTSYDEPVLLFENKVPIDPPDPSEHTVTVIEKYRDGSADVTNTYNVTGGASFTEAYKTDGVPLKFEVSAADARIEADYENRSLTIDSVDRDITITLTFAEGGDPVDPPDPSDSVALTNLLESTDFSDLDDWYPVPDGVTMDVGGDELTLTIDSSDDLTYISIRQDLNLDITHKYYVRSGMYFDKDTFPGASSFFTVLNLGNNQLLNARYTSGWVDASGIGSPSHNGTNRFQMMFRVSPTGDHLGGVMQCREPMAIDLTEAFGAGNEPSVAWCDANIPFFSGMMTINL